ncbi:MAG: helix-turn-helix transcriptional regulator [Myxococcales bacterium]|nr:helix-turn-helix transcriptional regulator [Myxococcales bacterium]
MKSVQPEKLLSNVGRRIAELRSERGLTQEALSEKLGVTTRWVQSAEAGGENFTLTTLARFANALKVPVADFFVPPTKAPARPGRPRLSTR